MAYIDIFMPFQDFEKEKMDAFDKKFINTLFIRDINPNSYKTCEKEVKSFFLTSLRQSYTLGQEEERKAWIDKEKSERLSCPFCVGGSWGGGDEFWNPWKIKHKYHE